MANRFTERALERKEARNKDYTLVFIIIFLLAFGLVMIYSTSSYEASMNMNNSTYYLTHQAAATVVGLFAMFVVSRIPYGVWQQFGMIAYGVSVVAILLIIPFGYEANGAKRWIRIMGISLQPAEIAKVGMIIFLASMICKMGNRVSTNKGFFMLLASVFPIFIMLWKVTDNMSSAIIVYGIAFLMLFVATPGYKRFIGLGVVGVSGAALIVLFIKMQAQRAEAGAMGFRGERILAWLDPEAYASGKGFQTLQALYAIGSGGIRGKGLGQSMQKLGFLPEAQNDMIFSIICEELGIIGAFTVIGLFVVLIWRLMVAAVNANDLFGGLLVVGVMGHISIQVILNIAVVTNTIPNTGISLPFISYGGSAVLFLLIELGIVLSVVRSVYYEKN